MPDLSNMNDPIILGGNKPSIIDDRMRELAEAVKTSFGKEHALTGEHAALYGLESQKPASPANGQFYFNFSSGKLEFYVANSVTYTGTDATVATGTPRVVTSPLSQFLSRIHAGAGVSFYLDADGAGQAALVDTVTSDTQLTLRTNYGGTKDSALPFTIVLQDAGKWVEVDKLLQESFEREHHIRVSGTEAQTGTGEHKFAIRTDGTNPDNVKNNQVWMDTSGGVNALRFRDAGTTKQIESGNVIVWLASPVEKVASTMVEAKAFTDISIAADTGAATAKAAIFQVRFSVQISNKTHVSAVVSFRPNGTSLVFPNVPSASAMLYYSTQTSLTSTSVSNEQIIVGVDANEICEYGVSDIANTPIANPGHLYYSIVLVGYIK